MRTLSTAIVDPNVLPALIAVLAHAGDQARYEAFLERFRAAATPQEEQRYLYALAGFQQPALVEQTLARTINGEIRTQDAPFVVRTMSCTAMNDVNLVSKLYCRPSATTSLRFASSR